MAKIKSQKIESGKTKIIDYSTKKVGDINKSIQLLPLMSMASLESSKKVKKIDVIHHKQSNINFFLFDIQYWPKKVHVFTYLYSIKT